MKLKKEPVTVVTVCGVGMGSSLILKMTAEDALRELGVRAVVEHADLGSVKSMNPDVILAQPLHSHEVEGLAPVVVSVTNFLDKEGLKGELARRFREVGWAAE